MIITLFIDANFDMIFNEFLKSMSLYLSHLSSKWKIQKSSLMNLLEIEKITPYARNPRKNQDIDKVALVNLRAQNETLGNTLKKA